MAGTKRPKREDANERAFRTLQEITGERPKTVPPEPKEKDAAAVSLGSKGGKARAERMTKEQRSAAAKKAVAARWAKKKAD